MNNLKIGVMVDSFKIKLEEGIKKAAEVGAQGLQIYAIDLEKPGGPVRDLRQHLWSYTKEIMKLIKENGLQVSALCSEMGGFAHNALLNPEKIEKTKKIITLACEMDTNVVTAHIGIIPEDTTIDTYKIMQDACGEIGEFAAQYGVRFAIETGPETTESLKKFIDSIESKGIGVNFDPANLVMLIGDDTVKGVHILKDYIVHTHAKDGVMFKPSYPQRVYGIMPKHVETLKNESERKYMEMPLGEGQVDFKSWIEALELIGYKGFLTIEREVGSNPENDICMAVNFLKNLIK
jgi:sugar phosphate isomerase/epimerase